MNRLAIVFVSVGLACVVGACQGNGEKSGSDAGIPSAKVNPKALQAQAALPPPASAKPGTSIGSGPLMVNTANSPSDSDFFWTARINIDGDNEMETADLLWDDDDKVLFVYGQMDVMCVGGGMATVSILAGVNGAGNPRGRPAGSGFYAIYFDGMECGADRAGVYGCRFDSAGYVTEWGAVVVDSMGDEIDAVGN